jgi:Tfp pilus assembly protein PilW
MKTVDPRQAGFSMVELLVAMVMTLIISGAIFGLLTGGQNAFRREPAMTDRQQNIRVAMDLIKRDVAGAGAGMVPFVQAFTNGLNGAGGAPSSTQTAGSSGQPTDILEILSSSGQCPAVTLAAPPSSTGPWSSNDTQPSCFPDLSAPNSFFYVGSNATAERSAFGVEMGKSDSAGGTNPFQILLVNPATANVNPTAGPSAGFCDAVAGAGVTPACLTLMPIDVVRYQIAPDPQESSIPDLYRSRTGRFDSAGNIVAPPGGNWEIVARGIEDLQIEYMNGSGAFATTPGNVTCAAPCNATVIPPGIPTADLNTVVRQVRVTLSARAAERGRPLQGSTTAGGSAGNAIRGQLVTVIAPRAALSTLTLNSVTNGGWY